MTLSAQAQAEAHCCPLTFQQALKPQSETDPAAARVGLYVDAIRLRWALNWMTQKSFAKEQP